MSNGILKRNLLPFTMNWWMQKENVSVAKNSNATVTFNVTNPGYVAIGGLDFMTGSADCTINHMMIENNTLNVVIHNWSASAKTCRVGIQVFFVREDLCQVER